MCTNNRDIELTSYIQDISDVISKVSQIKYSYGAISDISRISELFRAPYGFSVNNTFEKLKEKEVFREKGIYAFLDSIGCLWLDLIGYDFNTQKQDFYALFSIDEKHKKNREPYIYIYNHYLNSSDKYFIDVILQLCYNSNNIKIEGIDQIRDWGIELCVGKEELSVQNESYKLSLDQYSSEKVRDIVDELYVGGVTGDDIIKKLESLLQIGYPDDCSFEKEYINVKEYLDEFVKCRGANNYIDKNFARTCIINKLLNIDVEYIYFIPIFSPSYRQIGHMACAVSRRLDSFILSALKILANSLLFPLSQAYLVTYFLDKVKTESIKSAKAAIMSRNMSHNLGSHVMAYLKQNLGSVIDIVKGNVIEKIVSNNQLNSKIDLWNKYLSSETRLEEVKEDENIYKNQIELPFLVGIGHFISYMQERQDYIATVATDYVPYFSSLNFKDDIYDVLNPDLRYLRHTDRIGGRPDNILLSFIARSEGLQRPAYASVLAYEGANIELKKQIEFESLKSCCIRKRENDIVLKFRGFDGLNDVQYVPVTISLDGETIDISRRMHSDGNGDSLSCGIGRKDLDDMRSFNLSLPGGIAGRQAIFSIIENIIRNAAKHGAWEKRLDIVFDVFDCSSEDVRFTNSKVNEDLYQLRKFLSDNGYFDKEDSRDLYVLTITDNIQIESKKVEQLRAAIEQKYVYDDGSMINENKGIKEIKISASWLRNLTHEKDEAGMAPILNVRLSNGHLQYIICVPKVKKYAIICSKPELYSGEYMQSIYYYTEASFKAEKNKSFEVIAILDTNVGEEIYEGVKNRIIPISPNHIVRIDSDDLDAIRTKLTNMQEGKMVPEDLQQKIDNIYARMYKVNDYPEITIIDKKVAKSVRETYCNDRIVCLSGETATLPIFMYKTHLETEKNFYSFLNTHILGEDGKKKEEGVNLKFAEGISGGNSTDRLVRGINCNFTSEWYYKHLNAMLKKVAIFDERLFSRMTNLTDNELVAIDRSVVDAIELGVQNTPNENLKFEEVQELKKIGLEVDKNDTYQQVYDSVFEDIKMLLSAKKYAKSHLIAVNFYKNVHIYNIIYNNATCCFDIYGYTGVEKEAGEIKLGIEKVGEISRTGDIINIKFEYDGFDYLSIHQGLLDKIYHQWDIVGNSKCAVTQAFYEKIMKKEMTIDFDRYQYMPGFIIHSGRAKPSTTDMPQKQPFIQYASVDHAVSDCKYTLVELLDDARYE